MVYVCIRRTLQQAQIDPYTYGACGKNLDFDGFKDIADVIDPTEVIVEGKRFGRTLTTKCLAQLHY